MPKTKSSTTETGLLIGIRPLIEAIEAHRDIDKIYLQKNLKGPLFKELWAYLRDYQLPYVVVPKNRLDKFTRQNHQGVVAQLSAVPFQDLREIVTRTFEKGEAPLLVILDRVSDLRNLGAIARTAEATGCHALVTGTRQSAAINEDAMKTSAGALHHLPLCRESNLNETLEWLELSGIRTVAITEKAAASLYDTPLEGPLAILMGAEDKGIAPERLKLSHYQAYLPMHGRVGSLNVSVATGAALYEVLRQRNLSHPA